MSVSEIVGEAKIDSARASQLRAGLIFVPILSSGKETGGCRGDE